MLAAARGFLGSRSGLSEGQIGNWRRRESGMPDTFVEGAALYHSAQSFKNLVDPAEYTGIEADRFWQIFFVRFVEDDTQPGRNDSQPRLHCGILRYWENVRSLQGDRYLSHVALRSFDERKPPATPLGRTETAFYPEYDNDSSLLVSWKIDPEPHDCGYEVDFPDAIRNNHDEAVGGDTAIAVRSAHQLVFLPTGSIERLRNLRLPGNPEGWPSAFSTLPAGDPVRVMEGYLRLREDGGGRDGEERDYFRRLGPWFRQGPAVRKGIGRHEPPEALRERELYEEAMRHVDEGRSQVFSTRIDKPVPFLRYILAF